MTQTRLPAEAVSSPPAFDYAKPRPLIRRGLTALSMSQPRGSELWKWYCGMPTNLAPLGLGDTILVIGGNSHFYLLRAADGTELRRQPVRGMRDFAIGENGAVFAATSLRVYAFDVHDGTEFWRAPIKGRGHDLGILASGQSVYVACWNGNIDAFSAATGEQLWRFSIGVKHAETPSVVGDLLYLRSWGEYLFCIDASSGKERWRFRGWIPETPTIANGFAYFGSLIKNVYALETQSGSERWRFNTEEMALLHSVTDGFIIVSSGSRIFALAAESGEVVWRHDRQESAHVICVAYGMVYISKFASSGVHDVQAVDITSGAELWRFRADEFVVSAQADGNVLYLGRMSKALIALDAMAGYELWRFSPEASIWAFSLEAERKLYLGGTDGHVYALQASSPARTPL